MNTLELFLSGRFVTAYDLYLAQQEQLDNTIKKNFHWMDSVLT